LSTNTFDDDDSPVGPISFGVADSQLTLRFTFDMNRWIEYGDHTEQSRLAGVLEPFLGRNRMSLRSFEPDYNYQGPPWLWRGEIALKARGKSLSVLYQIGCQAIALLNAFESGQLTRESTGDLIRAGHAELLLGQDESQWLDVKSQHFDYTTAAGQIALAQSVGRFANAEYGGIVVIGVDTKRVPGGEIIRKICPVAIDGRTLQRCQRVIKQTPVSPARSASN
jgi:hypothetical protein